MIKLTWGNLRDREFMNSMGKLYGQPMGYAEGMKFALMGREIKKQQKLCDETHEGILKKFGTPDKENPQPGVYKLHEATKDQYIEEMKKLDATEFTVRIEPFNAKKLSDTIKFSPQDLMLLEPILLPLDAPEKEDAKPTDNVKPLREAPATPPAH